MVEMEFDALPNLSGLYVKAAIKRRKPPTATTKLPDLPARAAGVIVDDLDDYLKICAIADDGHLPPTYPQVLATPLHAAIVAHADFPLPALGMVHLENRVEQKRPIAVGEKFDLRCELSGSEWIPHLGLKFAIDTVVEVGGETIWKSQLWALSRGAKKDLEKRERKPRPAPEPGEVADPLVSVMVDVPADMGRRYSAVCGDYNPIHLYPLTAKLFGFKRPIVHGMWTFARCWAELANFADPEDLVFTVGFKQPLYLPTTALITAVEEEDGEISYRAGSVDGQRLFLRGKAHNGALNRPTVP